MFFFWVYLSLLKLRLEWQGNDVYIVKGLSWKNVDLCSSDSDLKFLRQKNNNEDGPRLLLSYCIVTLATSSKSKGL
jgi:hypothetical protein